MLIGLRNWLLSQNHLARMKKFLLPALLMSVAFASHSQVQLSGYDLTAINEIKGKNTPVASRAADGGVSNVSVDSRGRVSLIVGTDDESALERMSSLGAEVEPLAGGFAIVRVAPSLAVECAAVSGVNRAVLSRMAHLHNDLSRSFSNVDKVFSGEGLDAPYAGGGVVVGLFDSGLDPNHINFKDASGVSRVSRVWRYSQYGTCTSYTTPSAISSFTTDDTKQSHGTHTLGTITGSFKADDTHDYRGMAPEAEIVVCCGYTYPDCILDGVKRMAEYAESVNKPLVVNLSLGENYGPHDGSDAFAAALDEYAGKDNVTVCMSVGNEADEDIAVIKPVGTPGAALRTLLLPTRYSFTNAGSLAAQGIGSVLVISEDESPLDISLEIIDINTPDEPLYTVSVPVDGNSFVAVGNRYLSYLEDYGSLNVDADNETFGKYYKNSYLGGKSFINPDNNRFTCELSFWLEGVSEEMASTTFVCLTAKPSERSRAEKVYVYAPSTAIGGAVKFGNMGVEGIDAPDGNGSNSSMACGLHTVTVGSYVTRNLPESGFPDQEIGERSYYSSFGEGPGGRTYPDFVAPGQVIVSSRNSRVVSEAVYPKYYTYTDPSTKKTYGWTICSGTSMASPAAAGIIALWLSANPDLTTDELLAVAKETAVSTYGTSVATGAGMIDAYAGMKKILSSAGTGSIASDARETVMVSRDGESGFEIFAAGETSFAVSLVDLSGKLVRGGVSAGDTFRLDTAGVAPGVYLLSVKGAECSLTRKIIIR